MTDPSRSRSARRDAGKPRRRRKREHPLILAAAFVAAITGGIVAFQYLVGLQVEANLPDASFQKGDYSTTLRTSTFSVVTSNYDDASETIWIVVQAPFDRRWYTQGRALPRANGEVERAVILGGATDFGAYKVHAIAVDEVGNEAFEAAWAAGDTAGFGTIPGTERSLDSITITSQ